jgi:hypothetical protein
MILHIPQPPGMIPGNQEDKNPHRLLRIGGQGMRNAVFVFAMVL